MQIDLYPAPNEVTDPLADLIALLEQQGFQPTKSMVQGTILCPLDEKPLEAFLTAIHQWNAQQPGRQAQPDEIKFVNLPGDDQTLTITVQPSAKVAAQ